MERKQMCAGCVDWDYLRRCAEKDPWYKHIVVKGEHYSCTPGVKNPFPRGFGGRVWTITHTPTGETLVTNDLWHQGTIPDGWRGYFPDNATIVQVPEKPLVLP